MSAANSRGVSAAQAVSRALAALQGGQALALVTVVNGPSPDALGGRLLVTSGTVEGTLGFQELDERAVRLARESLASRDRGLRRIELEEAAWEVYIEPQHAPPELVIVGAGHIAQPLCSIGAMLGFRVTVMDDRSEYANRARFAEADRVLVVDFDDPFREVPIGPETYLVLVTRAHKYDYDCIRQLLKMEARPAYLGMIGSRRRVRAAFEALVAEGVDPGRLENVRAPVGLDIGAETPEEIAVSIAAEIISYRRGAGGTPLTEQERVLGRVARKYQAQKGTD